MLKETGRQVICGCQVRHHPGCGPEDCFLSLPTVGGLHCRYLVAFTFDTTLGLALAIGFHTLALNAAKHNAGHSRFAARVAECGSYGEAFPHFLRVTSRQRRLQSAGVMVTLPLFSCISTPQYKCPARCFARLDVKRLGRKFLLH